MIPLMPGPPSQPRNPDAISGIAHHSVLLRIARRGLTRFIAHLDWIVLFQQAIFRARLPIVLTEGYNKKVKAKYAAPLSTGCASECEYVQIWLCEPWTPEQIEAALGGKLPPDIVLLRAIPLVPPVPKNPWKQVAAARYALTLASPEEAPARQRVIDYLEQCIAEPLRPQTSVAERRKARKASGGATYGGDEDLMGASGGVVVPAARELFEEAGDPRDLDAVSGQRMQDSPQIVDSAEHYGRIHALEGTAEFLAGMSDTLRLIGALTPSLTLHPVRLAMAIEQEAGLQAIPLPLKESLLALQTGAWVDWETAAGF